MINLPVIRIFGKYADMLITEFRKRGLPYIITRNKDCHLTIFVDIPCCLKLCKTVGEYDDLLYSLDRMIHLYIKKNKSINVTRHMGTLFNSVEPEELDMGITRAPIKTQKIIRNVEGIISEYNPITIPNSSGFVIESRLQSFYRILSSPLSKHIKTVLIENSKDCSELEKLHALKKWTVIYALRTDESSVVKKGILVHKFDSAEKKEQAIVDFLNLSDTCIAIRRISLSAYIDNLAVQYAASLQILPRCRKIIMPANMHLEYLALVRAFTGMKFDLVVTDMTTVVNTDRMPINENTQIIYSNLLRNHEYVFMNNSVLLRLYVDIMYAGKVPDDCIVFAIE